MSDHVNFSNGTQEYNIYLDGQGNLAFKANDHSGDGETRMVLGDNTAQLTLGGAGANGSVQLTSSDGANTIYLGGEVDPRVLVGGDGHSGRVTVHDSGRRETVELDGASGAVTAGVDGNSGLVTVRNSDGATAAQIDGFARSVSVNGAGGARRVLLDGDGHLSMFDSAGATTLQAFADQALLTLGASTNAGEFFLWDGSSEYSVYGEGLSGELTCRTLTETGPAFAPGVAPSSFTGALPLVLRLRGVRYRHPRDGAREQLGLVADDVRQVLPELVSDGGERPPSLHYSRLGVVLLEAIREQQDLIDRQHSAIAALMQRVEALESAAEVAVTPTP